ncbi:MAG: sulfatase-like hydrolase/transferase [Paracoccaceae bacterium]
MMRLALPALTAALMFLVLTLPNHPDWLKPQSMTVFPLELPVVLLGILALGRSWWLPAVLSALFVIILAMKLADIGMFIAYDRTFDPVLDFFLIEAGLSLLRDSVGMFQTIAISVALLVGLAGLFLVLHLGLRSWSFFDVPRWARVASGTIAAGFLVLCIADVGERLDHWALEKSAPGTAWTSWLVVKRVVDVRETTQNLAVFTKDAAEDPYANTGGLLDAIGDRDVLIIFVESYGRASFDNPLYSQTHLTTLRAGEAALADAGFETRSGWLTSPTAGGQSWLAHGALSSGLWTSDHGRYSAMLASGRKTLFHLAQSAGFRTNAVMPAITLSWPESALMGFDQVFPAVDIPYKGERFNWVTMPDQFTLSAYEALLGEDPRRDFTQIALISSHAPWVPILPIISWAEVGDGAIYSQWANQGPTPQEVWRDQDRVRDLYRQSIDYALKVTLDHLVSLGAEAPLILLLGDHQPAGFVAQVPSDDVAAHLIAPQEVMARVDHWGWTPGLIPEDDAPVWRMDAFRDKFIAAFTSQTPENLEAGG